MPLPSMANVASRAVLREPVEARLRMGAWSLMERAGDDASESAGSFRGYNLPRR